MLQKLPLDLNTFSELRELGYLYVDKTKYAYDLVMGGRRYFIARPRRFGKSLFVSTLKEILTGNKELFNGLWIGNSDYQWQPHGVITLDISTLDSRDPESFRYSLCRELVGIAERLHLGITIDTASPILALKDLVYALHKKFGRVAILVDEYDNPILRVLHDPVRAGAIRDEIRDFFTAIKGLDSYINFVFITGVSSFIKAGLFSGINNLRIVTLNEHYAGACGYTEEEVDHYFSEYITAWAHQEKFSYGELRKKLKEWYNGYHFGSDTPSVYNPFSLMNALEAKKYDDYWFLSGMPTFLANILKKEYKSFDPDQMEINSRTLQGLFDVDMISLLAIMFQAGYLTVAFYDSETQVYTLKYPNVEVKTAIQTYLLEAFAQLDSRATERLSLKLRTAFVHYDIDEIIAVIKQLFAHVPYQLHMKEEKFYHALLQMAFTASGIKAQSEYSTSHGRIDLVLDMSNYLYVIEVKFKESAEAALVQIEERRYYERFLHQGKKVILLGLSFKREPSNFDVTYAVKELA